MEERNGRKRDRHHDKDEYQYPKSSRAVQAPIKRSPFPPYRRIFHAFGRVAAIGERALCQSVLCSYACAICKMRASSSALPNNCKPIGKRCPSTSAKPHGTLIPQIPARFAGLVKISARYICKGSSVRSPSLKAGTGEVGEINASTFSNAFAKSCRISSRTFCARK